MNLLLTTRLGVGSRCIVHNMRIAASVAIVTVKNCQQFREKKEIKELKYLEGGRFPLSTKLRCLGSITNAV